MMPGWCVCVSQLFVTIGHAPSFELWKMILGDSKDGAPFEWVGARDCDGIQNVVIIG